MKFRRGYGRFPRGYIEGEQQLYSFLQSQRERYRAGKLQEERKRYLDTSLPGWLTPPKAEREHALWQQRLRELEKFLQEKERYPRYKTAAISSEKVLAVWITHQRKQLRSGKLSELREKTLDKTIPGWNLA
ncbi:helicase associated domain-containing protein [Arthrobacter citreus]|uniref:helicase associated domain-containing protein n=1 Tax=Arthrobacter TaxID=1663 RepID=UPI0012654BDF|nr:helicase associated domain-containing protein [Arthrobacter gandavensis]